MKTISKNIASKSSFVKYPRRESKEIHLEVVNLYNEELDADSSPQAHEMEMVTCPRCKGDVPSSIYCGACGCPLEVESAKDTEGSGENHFDLESLKEIQGEIESQKMEESASRAPVEKESLTMIQGSDAMKAQSPKDTLDALDTRFHAGPESPRKVLSAEAAGNLGPVIDKLATELFNSAYLELWSVSLFRRDEMDENQFLKVFEGYRDRLDRCIGIRDDLLNQIRDLGTHDVKVREARIELDKLDVRKSLGDLHEGEYQAMVPALRWTIDHYEVEAERRQNRIALLEDPLSLMSAEKVREVAVMAEEGVELLREVEAFARISPGTAAMVRDSVKMIQGIL
ncbi:MAG: hypothetical protein ACXABF_11265 [Candidatus Thorarchaeota archaeon]|jgi:hypothetical protein